MKKIWFLFFIFLGILFFSGCQENSDKSLAKEKHNLLLSKSSFLVKPSVITINDRLLALLANKKGVFLYELGKEVTLSKDSATEQWLHYDGKNLYAFWWYADSNKAKYLKVRVSKDQGVTFDSEVVLNSGTGVLPDISIASDGQGNVAVAYTDERKLGYGVYINYSKDSGSSWQKNDIRLDQSIITDTMRQSGNTDPATFANSPKLAFLKNTLIAIWQQVDMTEAGHKLRIISKALSVQNDIWESEVDIFSAPNMQPVSLSAFNDQEKLYVFGMLGDEKGFTGFYTHDSNAQHWAEINNIGLGINFNKQLISWVRGVFSGDNLVLTFTSRNTDNTGKVHANVAVFSTKTHQWLSEAHHLDADKGHDLTKSTYPDIVNTSSGVIIVWEDYRPLVPALYMNISKDNGKSWQSAPQPLTTPGTSVAKDPRWILGKDKLWLTYFLVILDGKNPEGARMYQEYDLVGGQYSFPKIVVNKPSKEELKSRLIDRVNKFWSLREERKWEETWDYMEPVYRERFNKAEWLAQQGRLSFSKTVVDENSVIITDNIGILDANVDVSVNQQVAKEGLLESAPPKNQKVEMRWGWFYDDWYFMPEIIFGNHLEY